MAKKTIGIIVPRMDNHCITSALRGIEQLLDAHGFELMITHSHESIVQEAANTRLLLEQDVKGVIASLSRETTDLGHFRAFTVQGIPVVFFDQMGKMAGSTSVVIDNWCCGFAAAEHLVRQGCMRIAIVTSDLQTNAYLHRYEGFLQALRDYDIPFSDDLLIIGETDEQSGLNAAAQLLCMEPMPDGLFVTSDLVAAVCMQALKSAGVGVPEDIAVVGFNNEPAARLTTPSLSTIGYSGFEVGRTAARHLLDQLTDDGAAGDARTIVIPAELIVRNSSLRIDRIRLERFGATR